MTIWSSIPDLQERMELLEKQAAEHGIILSLKKEIPYGTQICGEDADGIVGTVSLYFSAKKGFSSVISGKSNPVSMELDALFMNKKRDENKPFRPRIGSDEAGKGDFFGPLTAAAFFIETPEMEQELLALGIRDSKKLNDKKISEMARQMRAKWPDHFVIISPSVEKYNNLYSSIGNLNRLLGWMHGRILADLSAKFPNYPLIHAIVDKFADEKNVTQSTGGLERLKISAITHGEDAELAIAAASILARDRFVYSMKKMNEAYEMEFPLGAGNVKDAGRAFLEKFGRARLHEVAKVHFKTANEL